LNLFSHLSSAISPDYFGHLHTARCCTGRCLHSPVTTFPSFTLLHLLPFFTPN
jgi:hypothetical protein